jgi:hypothetical protein
MQLQKRLIAGEIISFERHNSTSCKQSAHIFRIYLTILRVKTHRKHRGVPEADEIFSMNSPIPTSYQWSVDIFRPPLTVFEFIAFIRFSS